MSTAVADWPKFLAKLKARQEIAERTMAFRFEKPASFKFIPGQFIDITLLNPKETDSEGNTRGFSIASAPYEDFIMVATRLRDTAFKRVLKSIPFGVAMQPVPVTELIMGWPLEMCTTRMPSVTTSTGRPCHLNPRETVKSQS